MKPQRCLVSGANGDCYRACVASIVELPIAEVPHFADGCADLEEMYCRVRDWLFEQGYGLFRTYCSAGWTLERLLKCFSEDNPGVPIIISGVARANPTETHAVVALNGRLAHDPSGAGLSGPWKCNCGSPDCDYSIWWLEVVAALPCQMEDAKCAA